MNNRLAARPGKSWLGLVGWFFSNVASDTTTNHFNWVYGIIHRLAPFFLFVWETVSVDVCVCVFWINFETFETAQHICCWHVRWCCRCYCCFCHLVMFTMLLLGYHGPSRPCVAQLEKIIVVNHVTHFSEFDCIARAHSHRNKITSSTNVLDALNSITLLTAWAHSKMFHPTKYLCAHVRHCLGVNPGNFNAPVVCQMHRVICCCGICLNQAWS